MLMKDILDTDYIWILIVNNTLNNYCNEEIFTGIISACTVRAGH